jgi:hypothetical protein
MLCIDRRPTNSPTQLSCTLGGSGESVGTASGSVNVPSGPPIRRSASLAPSTTIHGIRFGLRQGGDLPLRGVHSRSMARARKRTARAARLRYETRFLHICVARLSPPGLDMPSGQVLPIRRPASAPTVLGCRG